MVNNFIYSVDRYKRKMKIFCPTLPIPDGRGNRKISYKDIKKKIFHLKIFHRFYHHISLKKRHEQSLLADIFHMYIKNY